VNFLDFLSSFMIGGLFEKKDFNKVVNIVNIVLPSSEKSPAENQAEKTLYQ